MSDAEPPSFDEFVDHLRRAIGIADAVKPDGELHDFRKLMEKDYGDVIPEQWWTRAFERLTAEGHLDPASGVAMGPSPHGRLSDAGHTYLESQTES